MIPLPFSMLIAMAVSALCVAAMLLLAGGWLAPALIGGFLLGYLGYDYVHWMTHRKAPANPLLALAHYGLGQSYMALRRYASAVVAFTDCRDTYARLAGMALSDTVSANQRREDEIREIRDSIRMFRSTRVKTANSSDTNPYVLQLESRLRDNSLFQDVTTDLQLTNPEITVDINRDRALAHVHAGTGAGRHLKWACTYSGSPEEESNHVEPLV